MLIRQFPDIEWLKANIRDGFREKKAVNGLALKHVGWPSVVLNTQTKTAERKDIKGPFSFFANFKGTSTIGIEGKHFQINELCYTLSNREQHYDLLIDDKNGTETINIHFGEQFFARALYALSSTDQKLLDNPFSCESTLLNVQSNSMVKSPQLVHLLGELMHQYNAEAAEEDEETILFDILKELLIANSREVKSMQQLPVQSQSTKTEIMKRLFQARDYIHSCFFEEIGLDELSHISCLSKFHFLRLFKQAFGQSPYQYQKQLRIQRAMSLYQQGATLEGIAEKIGVLNASSVSRMIRKQYGAYPSQIRQ